MGLSVRRKDGTRIGMVKNGRFIPNHNFTDEDKSLIPEGADAPRVQKRRKARSDDVQESGDS